MTMMTPRKALIVGLIVVAAGGCATPTEADLAYAKTSRESVSMTLLAFAGAIRGKDTDTAAVLVSPQVSDARRAAMERAIGRAVWMELYAGYRPDVERAVAGLDWRALRGGTARVKVRATSAAGLRFKDEYLLTHSDDGWLIAGLSLQEPIEYERLDPPAEDAAAIRAVLSRIVLSLREGRPAEVFYRLPEDKGARLRPLKRSFLARLFGLQPELTSVYPDLRAVCSFSVQEWPDPEKVLPLAYIAPNIVAACYDIPYMWVRTNIGKPDEFRMEVFLHREEGEWRLLMLRLYAEGIPE